MIFNNYFVPRDNDLNVHRPRNVVQGGPLPKEVNPASIEEPIMPISEMGMSITEGQRFGTFIQSMQKAIRMGAGRLELATGMGGGQEPVGAENYGTEARQELREIAKANQVKVHSIHAPSNIGNMSGYNPQERGFNEEYRKTEIEEIKKAIDFAADVTEGASVVVHTGEFMRDMTSQPWNRKLEDGDHEFLSYEEEPERQVLYMVDDRTGKLINEVRKSQVIREPEFQTRRDPNQGNRERWIDKDGNFIKEDDPADLFKRVPIWEHDGTKFRSKRLTWDDFQQRAAEWNKYNPRMRLDPVTGKKYADEWTPEEVFFKSQMDMRILQSRGSSLYHGRFFEPNMEAKKELQKALQFYKEIEKNVPPEEQWKLLKEDGKLGRYLGQSTYNLVETRRELPSNLIQQAIDDIDVELKYIHEASAAADAQADETYETLLHVKPIEKYAKDQTSKSYAEAGIHAMQKTKEKHLKDPIFVAPENIFPEMGYGSHPDELIELVQNARKRMVEYLSQPYIKDPKMGWQKPESADAEPVPKVVKNPYYQGIDKKKAEKLAENHIKATLDTQHLGMWWKHFQPKPNETVDQRKKRFDKWYMEQIGKMADSGIIGNIHLVDAMGAGHHHLPAGQGVMPVVEAVKYLKKRGFTGNISSEGHGEGQMGEDRQLTKAWEALGHRIHSGYAPGAQSGFEGFGAPVRWTDVHQSYFGSNQPPYFVFGNYAPSNDWSLWSQVPME